MTACGHCRAQNGEQRRYCGQCGQGLRWRCSRCEFDNLKSDRFCGGCGDSQQGRPVQPAPAPEKRASTVGDLFSMTDLRGLMNKAQAKDEEGLPAKVTQDDLDKLFGELA